MPYLLVPDAIVQVTFEGIHDGQQTITTLNYKNVNTSPVIDGRLQVASLLDNITAAGGLYDLYCLCLSQDVQNIRIYGQVITPTRYAYVQGTNAGGNGSIPGPCMPANTAQVVTRRGDIADHHNISDLHLPGVPIASVLDSKLTVQQLVALQTFLDESLRSYVTAGGASLVPVAFNRTTPSTSRELIEGYPQDTVRIVRRRTVGLGT